MATFGEIFKRLRLEKGMTQDELLTEFNDRYKCNYYKQTISNYENGRRTPEVPTLMLWAEYFGVSVDYILGLSDSNNDTNMKLISKAMKNMTENEKKKMIDVLKIIFSDYF